MPAGKPCADSSAIVTKQIDGKNLIELAIEAFAEPPVLWGRYFTSTSTTTAAEYRHIKESEPLRDRGIRVLPIARQTTRVSGTVADGAADATTNAEDFILSFGVDALVAQGAQFLVFLDVEGSPPLSASYYIGWANTLAAHSRNFSNGRVTLLPCVYATQGDTKTWSAVNSAISQGAVCEGAWVARWRIRGKDNPADVRPLEYDPQVVNPKVHLPFPILLWQYADDIFGGDGFDCSEINPNIDFTRLLVNRCVLPPTTTDLIS